MWLAQPMRTSPCGSVSSLLGQSRCEKQEGVGLKGGREKGEFAQCTTHKFTPSAFSHTVHYPFCTTPLSLPPLYHPFTFSIFPFFSHKCNFPFQLNPALLRFPTACFCTTIRSNYSKTNTPVLISYITLASLQMFSSSWNQVQVVQIYRHVL